MKAKIIRSILLAVFAVGIVSGCRMTGNEPNVKQIGPGAGGGAFFVRFDPSNPDIIYAGMDCGGFYRSDDRGKTWKNITGNLFKHCLVNNPEYMDFDPENTDRIYVLAHGVRISNDKGETWEAEGLEGINEPWGNVRNGRISVNPYASNKIYAGFMSGLLWESPDKGKTWGKLHKFPSAVRGISFLPSKGKGPETIFVGTEKDGVYESSGKGVEWTQVNKGLPNTEVRGISAAFDKKTGNEALYACIQTKMEQGKPETYQGGIYKTVDRGATWIDCNKNLPRIDLSTDFQKTYSRYFNVFAITPEEVYTTGSGFKSVICFSDDGGKTWESKFNKSRVCWLDGVISGLNKLDVLDVCSSAPENVAISDTWQIWLSRDGGKTHEAAECDNKGGARWKNRGTNHLCAAGEESVKADPIKPNNIYFAYHDVTFASSDDRGETYFKYFFEPNVLPYLKPTTIIPDPQVSGRLYMSVQKTSTALYDPAPFKPGKSVWTGGFAVSDDYGRHWKRTFKVEPKAGFKKLDFDLEKGTDLDRVPLVENKDIENSGLPQAMCTNLVMNPFTKPESRILYIASLGYGVYKSVDSGKTWKKTGDLPVKSLDEALKDGYLGPQVIDLEFVEPGKVYAVLASKAKNWTDWYGTGILKYKAKDLTEDGVLEMDVPPKEKRGDYKADCRIYLTEDGGKTWKIVNDKQFAKIPVTRLRVDPFNKNRILACAYGGIFESLDGGKYFKHLLKHYNIFDVKFDLKNQGILYAGTDFRNTVTKPEETGILASEDNGITWKQIAAIPDKVASVEIAPDDSETIYCNTIGSGAWKVDLRK
ncbi:MAG: hypothetical protein A2020_02605 [Lentisphaerae bacterium GWF2_45_14]|nr:MAG: hypothetical protein A2020_02605 [Lentisphaerae bacterium GWF2_45_14]